MKTRIMLQGPAGRQTIGIGVSAMLRMDAHFDAAEVDAFLRQHAERTSFVMVSYELGRHFLQQCWQTDDLSGFPWLMIWIPETAYFAENGILSFKEGDDTPENKVLAESCLQGSETVPFVNWKARLPKKDYLGAVNRLKQHIQRGDVYEVNFCQEFFADKVRLPEGAAVFHQLNAVTQAPFALYFESDEWMIASASPERFLRKEGKRLFSQPIKGTARRGENEAADVLLKKELEHNEKERTENVMIVDLVRNDLSRLAAKNSVTVDELFGVHTFPTVHQMISTVSCELKPNTTFPGILEATFPMGSMTGAPKMAAVGLSDRLEGFSRGIYSGSIGYITPSEGVFDLNVMIRSLVYDKKTLRFSCGVGGAITAASDAEAEYEECRTKVGRILEIFGTCQW